MTLKLAGQFEAVQRLRIRTQQTHIYIHCTCITSLDLRVKIFVLHVRFSLYYYPRRGQCSKKYMYLHTSSSCDRSCSFFLLDENVILTNTFLKMVTIVTGTACKKLYQPLHTQDTHSFQFTIGRNSTVPSPDLRADS